MRENVSSMLEYVPRERFADALHGLARALDGPAPAAQKAHNAVAAWTLLSPQQDKQEVPSMPRTAT
jgi:hypothetical protein